MIGETYKQFHSMSSALLNELDNRITLYTLQHIFENDTVVKTPLLEKIQVVHRTFHIPFRLSRTVREWEHTIFFKSQVDKKYYVALHNVLYMVRKF